jgi:hypothetical protein
MDTCLGHHPRPPTFGSSSGYISSAVSCKRRRMHRGRSLLHGSFGTLRSEQVTSTARLASEETMAEVIVRLRPVRKEGFR